MGLNEFHFWDLIAPGVGYDVVVVVVVVVVGWSLVVPLISSCLRLVKLFNSWAAVFSRRGRTVQIFYVESLDLKERRSSNNSLAKMVSMFELNLEPLRFKLDECDNITFA